MEKQGLKSLLETKDGTRRMVEQCLKITRENTKIIIFGAGVGGGKLYGLLKANALQNRIIAFSDNNELKFHKTYMHKDLTVTPPRELALKYGLDSIIFVASSAYDLIQRQLISYGYSENRIFLFNFAFMDLEYTDKQFIWDHIEDFQRAYDRLEDEKSKRIFANILNYRITKNDSFLYHMQADVDDEAKQYFPEDLLIFPKTEVFLDIGAYTGDTFVAFDTAYKGEWKKYIGLEADGKIYAELENFFQKYGMDDRIRILNLAAWDRKTVLYYQETPGSSSMKGTDNGNTTTIEAAPLDDMLGNEEISFAKMDIEGAEYQAITGMKGLIKENRPVLAISVYHKRDDFYKLTDLIDAICAGEYSFYFRQYRFTPTETVCYAIPKNRKLDQ